MFAFGRSYEAAPYPESRLHGCRPPARPAISVAGLAIIAVRPTPQPDSMKRLVLSLATVIAFAPLGAQQATRTVTAADYDKAVRLLAPAVGSLVTGGSVAATW